MSEYTHKAEAILRRARAEAQLLRHASVDTRHLLLGLLQETEGDSARALQLPGVELVSVRAASKDVPAREEGSVRFARELRQTVHLASDEARKRQQPLAVEHLWLALTLLPANLASQVLQRLGVHLAELRAQALQAFPSTDDLAESPPFRMASKEQKRDKFTPRARLVLYRAIDEAWLFEQHVEIAPFFVGLLCAGEGVALQVLRGLGVDPAAAEQLFVQQMSELAHASPDLTPRSRRAIMLAVKEAVRFGHHYLGTEHLLLGMLRSGEELAGGLFTSLNPRRARADSASSALASFGLTLKRARRQTAIILATGVTDEASGVGSFPENLLTR